MIKKTFRSALGLQGQFQLALGIIFLFFCGFSAWLIYSYERDIILKNALDNSRIVMAEAESTRAYVMNVLRPRMQDFAGKGTLILEAMSAPYVSHNVMEKFNESMPEFRYRRVAVNARNPKSIPSQAEMAMITYFRNHPGVKEWHGIRDIDGSVGFLYALPVRMSASCLQCHGKPDDAPKALIHMYGSRRGFGYHKNEVAGIMTVSIPMRLELNKIRKKAFYVFGISSALLFILYLVISLLFNGMVVRSLRNLLSIFREGLGSEHEAALLEEATKKNEIHELSEAARELTLHLKNTRKELVAHAEELEDRVAERTRDLEDSRKRLKEKIETRNRELKTLNWISELTTGSSRLTSILPGVLEQTLNLIPAKGAAIYLFSESENRTSLSIVHQKNAELLTGNIDGKSISVSCGAPSSLEESIWQAGKNKISYFSCLRNKRCLSIPLSCRERVLGVMTFTNISPVDNPVELESLLMSVGKQIGIAIDSLRGFSDLLHSKELLQTVFDGIPDMMVLLGPGMEILMANKPFLKWHGTTLEEALQQKCLALEGLCDCPFVGKKLSKALSTGQPAKEEVTIESGAIYMVYYYPIIAEDGEISGILRYAKDITLERQVEQRIQQTEKMAAIGQLAAGVAHEINNPLGIILCYIDLLKRQLKDDKQSLKDIEIIEKQADNCKRIVSDLLNFSRTRKTESRSADINKNITDVVNIVRQQFIKRGKEITVRLGDNIPVIMLDMDKMKQVFLNLIINAGQAISGSGGKIEIDTRFNESESAVEIAIRNNGPEIAPEIIDRIFDPFFSTKKPGEGTGLGLSVSYGIVKDHGGEISVTTEEGGWTEFVVKLPSGPNGERSE